MAKQAKVFSVIDVKDGFFHVPLDYQSSLMTAMHTSYGRYRWLVLPNGITSAPEEFQMRLLQVLDGLSGIIVIADDILVFGSGDTYEEAEKDHDRNLTALMDRAEEMNLFRSQNTLYDIVMFYFLYSPQIFHISIFSTKRRCFVHW